MAAPVQANGEFVHGVPILAAPVHGAKVPVHGSAPVVTTPASGAPIPSGAA